MSEPIKSPKFVIYCHALVGNEHSFHEFDDHESAAAFVQGRAHNDSYRLRIFYAQEMTWKPRDIVKSVELVLK